MFGSNLVMQYFGPFYFCNHLDVEERSVYLTLIVFLKSCDCQCFMAFIPHSAVGWSAVCDSGIP